MWVGLSAVRVECTEKETPLSKQTNTGKLLSTIEELNHTTKFYKTNLVKCLPLDGEKIRYPKQEEMQSCHSHLEKEINQFKPKIVFLLGKQVANFLADDTTSSKLPDNFSYKLVRKNSTIFVSVHHPSYMLVYKRKKVNSYVKSLSKIISTFA